jgi:hypothetical protein
MVVAMVPKTCFASVQADFEKAGKTSPAGLIDQDC